MYPKFKINVFPTKIVDHKIFDIDDVSPPMYFTFARKDLQDFLTESLPNGVCSEIILIIQINKNIFRPSHIIEME